MKICDLIIILGSPASGKTTLAHRLSATLGLPCLHKDDIKECLFDALGIGDPSQSRRFSDASFAVALRIARTQLEAGLSCIIEGNWRPAHAAAVRAVLGDGAARPAQVWCRAEPGEMCRRFASRVRHPGHLDAAVSEREVEAYGRHPPTFLELDGPRWIYDSDDPRSHGRLIAGMQSWRL